MKYRSRLIIIVGSMFFSTASYALGCDGILSHGLRNIQIEKSAAGAIATKYFNHCLKDFSSTSDDVMGSIEVEVFGYGSGGGQFSRQQREEKLVDWCKTNKEYAESNQEKYAESQIIYGEAVAAWENCKTLASDGLRVEPTISADSRQVDISVVYNGRAPSGVKLYGVKSTGFECGITLPTAEPFDRNKQFAVKNEAVSISCTRDVPEEKIIQDQLYRILKRGVIVVETAQSPQQLYFPEEYRPSLPDQRATVIQQQLTDLESKIVPTGGVLAFNVETCPAGWKDFSAGESRVIVGAGKGNGLTNRKFGERDGNESVAMKDNNMPSHSHGITVRRTANGARGPSAEVQHLWQLTRAGKTAAFPAEDAKQENIDIMQPYIALKMCEKI